MKLLKSERGIFKVFCKLDSIYAYCYFFQILSFEHLKDLMHTHWNFVGASNLLWGLEQPNSDLFESTQNFGRADPHFLLDQSKNDEGWVNQIFC